MENNIQINGIVCEPSSADVVASTVQFDASVKELTIGEVTGTTKLNGSLKDGKLYIQFKPYFKWGFGKKKSDEAPDEKALAVFRKKLVKAGLQESQVDSVIELIENEFDNISSQTGDTGEIQYVEESKTALVGGSKCVIDQVSGENGLPIPDFPLNLDMGLDIKDISIDSVTLKANSQVTADDFSTSETTVSDLEVVTEIPLPFQSMEIDQISTPSVDVPRLDLPDLSTSFTVGEVQSPEIPLSLQTQSGSADITLNLVDWHPRHIVNIGFKILWKYVGIWIEFGLDCKISLHYKLLVNFLDVSLKLLNLVFAGLSFTLKLLKTAIVGAKLGAFKIAKIIGKMLGKSGIKK
jgi:hypothetical protein